MYDPSASFTRKRLFLIGSSVSPLDAGGDVGGGGAGSLGGFEKTAVRRGEGEAEEGEDEGEEEGEEESFMSSAGRRVGSEERLADAFSSRPLFDLFLTVSGVVVF